MTTQDDGFIGRWSRRKADNKTPGGLTKNVEEAPVPVRGRMITEPFPVKEIEDDQAEVDVALAVDEKDDEQTVEKSDTPPDLEELESINIEALDYDADFTKFMQAGVPERLRQRALRRLWSTNPILANVDGLNDYDEDFTDAALAVDVLKTSWKVGQGYLTDEEAAERDAERLGTDEEALEDEGPVAELSDDDSGEENLQNATDEPAEAVLAEVEDDDDLETDEA